MGGTIPLITNPNRRLLPKYAAVGLQNGEPMGRGRLTGKTVLMLLAISISSCSLSKQEREDGYAAKLEPMVGNATRDDVVQTFGLPLQREMVGENEYYFWRFKARKHLDDPYVPQKGTYFNHEELTIVFDGKGIMKSWKVSFAK
jgi:outer membrane protein assembly factor BamE (lipoprotein component of BamABCDE complex)